jgi:hypothetical protein
MAEWIWGGLRIFGVWGFGDIQWDGMYDYC